MVGLKPGTAIGFGRRTRAGFAAYLVAEDCLRKRAMLGALRRDEFRRQAVKPVEIRRGKTSAVIFCFFCIKVKEVAGSRQREQMGVSL